MIVKVQRPLTPIGAPWLVYDRSRSFITTFQPPAWVVELVGSSAKAFFMAEFDAGLDAGFRLMHRVPDEQW